MPCSAAPWSARPPCCASTCCTASSSRSSPPCSWPFISGACAKTAASPGRCDRPRGEPVSMEATAPTQPPGGIPGDRAQGPAAKALWLVLLATGVVLSLLGILDLAGVGAAAGAVAAVKAAINWMMGPVVYFFVSVLGFAAMLHFRQWTERRWALLLVFLTVA